MEINADFSQRIVVHSTKLDWVPSPMPGVDRRMLDRLGGEVARATSIVRYAKNSQFSAHTHGGGEEFLVLDGVFQDESGDFPQGSYVRNPPTSSHTPKSIPGCTIFVKLWQFDLKDRNFIHTHLDTLSYEPVPGEEGVTAGILFEDASEKVTCEIWQPETSINRAIQGGLELLVLEGTLEEKGEILTKGSWLRLPKNTPLHAKAGSQGARLWVKTGHLATQPTPPSS